MQVAREHQSWLIGGSAAVRTGLEAGGKFIGDRLYELSDFIKGKIDQPLADDSNPLAEQGGKLETAKAVTATVLDYTQRAFGGLYHYGGIGISAVYDSFSKSEKGMQLKESDYYEPLKTGALTLTKVASNIYEGVFNGVAAISKGTTKGISNIVEKTHGESTSKALDDVFETTGNAFKVVRSPKEELSKHINQT